MTFKTIRIECAKSGHGTVVYVDGVEVKGIYRLMLDVTPDKPPRLTLGIWAFDLNVSGEAEVAETRVKPDNAQPPDEDEEAPNERSDP